jgi:hypothetical protein
VLVDHADATFNGIAGGSEYDGLSVNADGTLFRPVKAGKHVHQCALAGAVLA